MKLTVTRVLEFDAAHRLVGHESACANLHGHRYVVELTVTAPEVDEIGRVIDFADIKRTVGGWIDEHLDHAAILHEADEPLVGLCRAAGWRLFTLESNPTAERLAHLLFEVASGLLAGRAEVARVRVRETPGCWADVERS